MKRFIIAVIAAIFAATSFVPYAEAGNGGKIWRHGGKHHGWNHRGWRGGKHYGWRHGYRCGGYRCGYRYGRWHGGYWGPSIVFAPGYYGGYDGYYDDYEPVCFVRKVRRFDYNGRPYIRRVRVCE